MVVLVYILRFYVVVIFFSLSFEQSGFSRPISFTMGTLCEMLSTLPNNRFGDHNNADTVPNRINGICGTRCFAYDALAMYAFFLSLRIFLCMYVFFFALVRMWFNWFLLQSEWLVCDVLVHELPKRFDLSSHNLLLLLVFLLLPLFVRLHCLYSVSGRLFFFLSLALSCSMLIVVICFSYQCYLIYRLNSVW